jgi:hypothetical protein
MGLSTHTVKTVADKDKAEATKRTIRIAVSGDRGIASQEQIEKADRQRRFEEAAAHVFTHHRELLRRLA